MKKILIVFVFLNFNLCFAQSFSAVKVYIANPYVERVRVVKTQMYNMDYVRSHYASFVFSMEQNYINAIFDSLQSFSMTEVAHDSIALFVESYWGSTNMDMNFEPCIVIDFIRGNGYSTNEDVWTFSVNKQGYICRTFHTIGNRLCYPNKECIDFLKRQYPGLFFLPQQ
ncbi:MAG: hypothetical protein SPL12_00070 [Bacteroidales bacterium]|nr:hypothetical protein [Bacteroidales bacterium]